MRFSARFLSKEVHDVEKYGITRKVAILSVFNQFEVPRKQRPKLVGEIKKILAKNDSQKFSEGIQKISENTGIPANQVVELVNSDE